MALQPGSSLGPYKIVSQLGQGGMGVVYQARDPRLDRHVAIKLLPPDLTRDDTAKQRFLQEAKAASALDHPNICTIHEINETDDGQLYLVMAHYEGETLKERISRGPLALDDAINIATQVGEGLAKAHAAGIVHRDIKPANLMVTTDGTVKILDFGLAKLTGVEGITEVGIAVGTVAYMSPEQAEGLEVDHRTDLWSLGVICCEMLTGQRPFSGDNLLAVAEAIRTTRPVVPADDWVQGILRQALAKDRSRRYQTARDMVVDLHYRSATSEAPTEVRTSLVLPSVAVLPFADMTQEKDQDYFCEGMAEEIINALASLEGLRVSARTSSFSFKGQALDATEIGTKLRVGAILEGSVRRAGRTLRITAQLVRVDDGFHFWSERYDRDMEDVFAVQDEIAQAVVANLKVKLLESEAGQLVRKTTEDLEAYHLYLQGRYYWSRRHKGFIPKAITYFEQAAARDPSFAQAHAGIAEGYVSLAIYGFMSPDEGRERTIPAAQRAVYLADDLAETHRAMAYAHWFLEWDLEAGERELRLAITREPQSGTTHALYGMILAARGYKAEAVRHANLARTREPTSLLVGFWIALLYFYAREDRLALDECERVVALDPSFSLVRGVQAELLAFQGDFEQAIALAEQAATMLERANYGLMQLGVVQAVSGQRERARATLDEMESRAREWYVPAVFLAMVTSALGDTQRTIELMARAQETREPYGLFALLSDRVMDPARSAPGFQALIQRIRLPAQH